MTDPQQRTPEEMQQEFHRELGQAFRSSSAQPDASSLDLKRYRKVRWFFAKAFLHILMWDIVLNRPVLRWLRTPPLPRWRRLSRRYRELAVDMGGVLIKLGQFLSIRVDILPTEVTQELAGLQDEVPAEHFDEIVSQLEADFGGPVADRFAWISPTPLGAASLAQTHPARLGDGTEVVIKVLRPGIHARVETDLAALALALRWLSYYPAIRRRVDVAWLADEFTRVTRTELDLTAEGRHAERFQADFADTPDVYIPRVYWDYSAARTLTLEHVGYIRIADLEGLDAVGIDRSQVAEIFYQLYMQQIFVTHFVHADPHPGNVFIKPLPTDAERQVGVAAYRPADAVPYAPNRPFQIVLIDFGMVAEIPERLRAALREYAIGLGTRDAYRMVQSYIMAGTLLPGADLKRLEAAHEALFERFWGLRMGQLKDVALQEARYFLREYRDLIYDAPFQFQADMLFVLRAVGILSGMAMNLDEQFDPWAQTIPFAERLAAQELDQTWRDWPREAAAIAQRLIGLPTKLDSVLTQAQRGDLSVRMSLGPDARRAAQQLEQAVRRLTWMVAAVGLLVSGVTLRIDGREDMLSGILLLSALLAFLGGLLKKPG
ncbi:MAG: AarF/UbiB family protein [Candidatus Tectomicrobia bacterium]|nr:AarF/UbiB family protein [Candidatus Tectomicrobia bacterium]